MKTHLSTTTNEVVARLNKNWDEDVKAWDAVYNHILVMSDALSDGMIKQFPEGPGVWLFFLGLTDAANQSSTVYALRQIVFPEPLQLAFAADVWQLARVSTPLRSAKRGTPPDVSAGDKRSTLAAQESTERS
jgi:hypothetical protein